jgi:hypothetical protein
VSGVLLTSTSLIEPSLDAPGATAVSRVTSSICRGIWWLARAYFLAFVHHDTTGALSSLDQAFLWIEHYIGRTPSMEYQYADAAERFFHDTGDKRFRDRALSWSHQYQRLQPWSAWASRASYGQLGLVNGSDASVLSVLRFRARVLVVS